MTEPVHIHKNRKGSFVSYFLLVIPPLVFIMVVGSLIFVRENPQVLGTMTEALENVVEKVANK